MYTPGGTVLIRTLEVGNVDWKKEKTVKQLYDELSGGHREEI